MAGIIQLHCSYYYRSVAFMKSLSLPWRFGIYEIKTRPYCTPIMIKAIAPGTMISTWMEYLERDALFSTTRCCCLQCINRTCLLIRLITPRRGVRDKVHLILRYRKLQNRIKQVESRGRCRKILVIWYIVKDGKSVRHHRKVNSLLK